VQPAFPGVLAALHSAVAGNTTQLTIFLANGANPGGVTAAELSQGLHESALCLELASPWNPDAGARARAQTVARLAAAAPRAALYPFDRAAAAGNSLVQDCLRWPATAPPAIATGDVNAPLPSIPVLLLAGARDLSTPLAWAQQEAREAPDGRLVVAPGAGHDVQLRAHDPAATAILGRFLQAIRA
jgi:pimeloyl-ACP methyl ester carboxylesterase